MRARFAIPFALVLAVVMPCAAQDVAVSETPASATTPAALYFVAALGGDAPDTLAAEACDAVRATLAAEGFGVVDPADVAATISPDRLRGAHRLDDLRPIAAELGATAIATVAVWTNDGVASSVIVSIAPGERSFSATEAVTSSLSESARGALAAALTRQRDALVVGGGTTSAHHHHDPAPPPPAQTGVIQNGQLFGIVGPGFLAALGAAGIAGGIYASLDETCDQRSAITGVCLRGERPNYAVGVLFITAGALAFAGAILWWILGSEGEEVSSGPRIDIVMLPDGGGYVGTRGTF